jgi:hypothetical protein
MNDECVCLARGAQTAVHHSGFIIHHHQPFPVLPNPPAPRLLAANSSTTLNPT